MVKRIYNTYWFLGLIFVFLTLIIFMFLEIQNGRFHLVDYEVYYKAAHRILQGENLFRHSDGHFWFKYSPVAAVYFIPFTLFSLNISKYVFWVISAFVITALHYISIKLIFSSVSNEKPSRINNITLLAALCLSVHYMFDIHLGQVNFILFLLYALTIYFYIKPGQNYLWPLFIAISLFLKPFALIFIPYFILKKNFKEIGLIIVYTFILALLPFIFYNYTDCIGQYKLWFNELVIEINRKQSLLAGNNHTIFSVLARYAPVRLLNLTPIGIKIFQLIILILIGLFILWFMKLGRKVHNSEIADFSILIAFIPLLSFTDLNSFGALFLVVYFILMNFTAMNTSIKILMFIGLFVTSANIYDIWGPKLFHFFKVSSFISIGTILLIASMFILRKKKLV